MADQSDRDYRQGVWRQIAAWHFGRAHVLRKQAEEADRQGKSFFALSGDEQFTVEAATEFYNQVVDMNYADAQRLLNDPPPKSSRN